MGKGKGWASIHRSVQENFLWDDKPFAKGQAWIDLILLANHEDTKQLYQGKIVEFKRGTVNRSILSLAERWGWDRKKVRRFLKILELEKMATINATRHRTTITLVNYDFYQNIRSTNNPNNDSMTTPTNGQPFPINNNENTENNEEQCSIGEKTAAKKSQSRFTPPTPDEVREYARSIGFETLDAEHFCDYYEQQGWELSNGRKMKDWKSAVRNWQRRERNNHTEKEKEVDTTNEIQRSGYGEINYL